MEENRNIPKLRFPGFTDDWEQRKFGEIAQRQSETMVSDDDNPCVEYEDVIAEQGTLNKDIFAKGVYKNGIRFTPEDVLYGKLRPYLHNWLNPDFSGVAVGDWWVLRPLDADKNFLFRLLQTSKYDDAANQSSGTKMPRADWKLVSNLEFEIPATIEEQKKIGEYFSNLDNLITLHQRKCDKIKEYKKGCLQKMFPKYGANVPEVRFSGFTDAWEQRKLGEITSLITKGTTPKDKSGDGEINFIKVENIDSSSGEIKDCSKISIEEHEGYLKRSQLKENDILFSIAGTLGRTTVVNKGLLPANTNQALAILRMSEGDISYIVTVLKGRAVSDFVRKNPTVGAQPNLSLEQVSNLEIPYPNIDEQVKIGCFFRELDNLITLHQRKLDLLKEYKKGLLQQMFV